MKLFSPIDALRLLGRPARGLADSGDLPILIAVGEDDPLGGPVSADFLAADYRERAGLGRVTTIVYPGARHEILNEPNRDQVIADVVAWIDRTLQR